MARTTAASAPYAARAVALRVRPLGEKDRIVTLYSPEKGRFSAVAKGARGPKSKLASVAQPFILARFLLAHGRSLDIINQAQIENAHMNIAGHIEKAAWASYGCEIVDNLPEGLPDERGFEILCVFLATLDATAPQAVAPQKMKDENSEQRFNQSLEAAGAWFQAQWLAHQGYGAVIGFCAACDEKIALPHGAPNTAVAFSAPQGGTLCAQCARGDAAHFMVGAASLRALFRLERSRRAPDSLFDAPFELNERASGELGTLLRRSIAHHLGARLRSQAFLDEIRTARRLGSDF
ncbi:DNA replication and repair protein RecO [Abditibacterium utsteinense]|uniref:DNA repair protein RecO n=1 Tax=Abditibacterium utsteinense TaxID=1960156 RepID=A0A2S8SVR4_9BACT|nr:DNA repair protein RecO [Abditibacterium utsteinense]PQV64896.1 DNA replication and repair protein RecO [Abditibacterium utsteinense]